MSGEDGSAMKAVRASDFEDVKGAGRLPKGEQTASMFKNLGFLIN